MWVFPRNLMLYVCLLQVGWQAPQQWVASPLGYNVLLSLLNENAPSVDKYREVTKRIKKKQGCKMWSKLFISPTFNKSNYFQNWTQNNIDVEETDFSKNLNSFVTWVQKFGEKGYDLEMATRTEFVLANALLFKFPWEMSDNSGASMKIINSFNYTSDIQYDARMLELPLCSSFKLVIIVPSETDRMDTLFTRLTRDGLAAAISSLHPVFTVNSKMVAPNINVSSTNIASLRSGSAMQCGKITVNEKGAFAKVLTYIMSVKSETLLSDWEFKSAETPFRFAIVSNDTPLLTGQFHM